MTSDQLDILQKAVNDARLSWRAKGILLAFVFNEQSGGCSRSWILENGREGFNAVATAVKELRALGYLSEKVVRNEIGRIAQKRFCVQSAEESSNP